MYNIIYNIYMYISIYQYMYKYLTSFVIFQFLKMFYGHRIIGKAKYDQALSVLLLNLYVVAFT